MKSGASGNPPSPEALLLAVLSAMGLTLADAQWLAVSDLMEAADLRFPVKGKGASSAREATQADIERFLAKN